MSASSAGFHPEARGPNLTITLRPITAADGDFLLTVYRSTREDELARIDWDDRQKAAFIRQQFDAQHHSYQQQYPDGSFQVVIVDGQPAGRLYVHQMPGETRVIDIALLAGFRGRGVGTTLLGQVLAGAEVRGDCVTIHVERNNPALRWYGGMGFQLLEDRGVYLFLRWQPSGLPAAPSQAEFPPPGPEQR